MSSLTHSPPGVGFPLLSLRLSIPSLSLFRSSTKSLTHAHSLSLPLFYLGISISRTLFLVFFPSAYFALFLHSILALFPAISVAISSSVQNFCSLALVYSFARLPLSISSSRPCSLSPFHLLYPPRTRFLASALSLSPVLSFPLPLAVPLSLFLSILKSSRDPSFLYSYLDFSLSLSTSQPLDGSSLPRFLSAFSRSLTLSLSLSLSLVLALFLSQTLALSPAKLSSNAFALSLALSNSHSLTQSHNLSLPLSKSFPQNLPFVLLSVCLSLSSFSLERLISRYLLSSYRLTHALASAPFYSSIFSLFLSNYFH